MTDNNDTRTTEQLLAEIEALKHQLAARGSDADQPVSVTSSEPIFSASITRRQVLGHALASWVSPVILSVPVVISAIMKPGMAEAAVCPIPTAAPTLAPTRAPTQAAKKGSPTLAPVRAPTAAPAPTLGPPTVAPPTVAPTAVPVPGLGLVGLAALGSALAASGAKLLKDRIGTSDADGPNSGGSEGDSGKK